MLVAIAIPVFTSQLEKSRESVDLSNVRAAYAEVMSAALTNTKTTENGVTYDDATGWSKEVDLKQAQNGWQTDVDSIEIGGIASNLWSGTPNANRKCTVSYTEAGGAAFKWE